MRVTSASAKVNSLAASAASRTLYDRARSEPGITRIFGTGMTTDDRGQMEARIGRYPRSVVRSARSIPAVDPDPRRRDVHPDALGGFRPHAVEAFGDRRHRIVGELDERRARRHHGEEPEQEPPAHPTRLVEQRQPA